MCTSAEQVKGGYDVFSSTSFECAFPKKVIANLQEHQYFPALLKITVQMSKATLSISSMVWPGSNKHISNFKFYLTIHIQMQDSKSKDINKPNLLALS
jgi:hypothetical protein